MKNTTTPQPQQMSKIKMSQEIFQAMEFLGIEPENFEAMKNEAGGMEELHQQMAAELSGNIDKLS